MPHPPGDLYDGLESEVRSYCRSFPASFTTARGAVLHADDGRSYLDFLAGAGALNYGHNHPRIKRAVLDHLEADGLVTGLDLHTSAKARFLDAFSRLVLAPRGLPYKVQFTGPTGADAVEAALKAARLATGRTGVVAFSGGYHGHSLGALAATTNRQHRAAAGVPLANVTFVPYAGGPGVAFDGLAYLDAALADTHSGIDLPAAVIVEAVQAEGGVWVAPPEWLRQLRDLCDRWGIVLIVDEIQTGCGRTGPFFAFEASGIVPDVVTVSKSISGFGLPMAVVLLRPELDVWQPGDHCGTFRGHQLAFVAGAAALEVFVDDGLAERTAGLAAQVGHRLAEEVASLDDRIDVRGAGLLWGVDLATLDPTGALTRRVAELAFEEGLIVERVGRNDTVVKLLPPLTITVDELHAGVDVLVTAVSKAMADAGILPGP